jgi:hypothetical protein
MLRAACCLLLLCTAAALRGGVRFRVSPSTRTPTIVSRTAAEADEADAKTAIEPSSSVEFPPEASPLVQAQRGLRFASQAVPIVFSYFRLFFGLQMRERVLGQCLDEEECEVLWENEHEAGSRTFAAVINELKGFYTKTGQIIATRQDLFPRQYTDRLAGLTDLVDPMPYSLVRAVVEQELLHDDETFDAVFAAFDEEPLGAASVAQVHRAVLTPQYGGEVVAVKVQRPAIEAKLLGDVAALKALAKAVRGFDALPVDYYTVFAELETQLGDEFDFIKEAAAMERIGAHTARGTRRPPGFAPQPSSRSRPLHVRLRRRSRSQAPH